MYGVQSVLSSTRGVERLISAIKATFSRLLMTYMSMLCHSICAGEDVHVTIIFAVKTPHVSWPSFCHCNRPYVTKRNWYAISLMRILNELFSNTLLSGLS